MCYNEDTNNEAKIQTQDEIVVEDEKTQAEINKYDMQCKSVLMHIDVLAHLCKEGIPWCKKLSIKEITDYLRHPLVNKHAKKITQFKVYDDNIALDLCFLIYNPFTKRLELCDVDVQNKFYLDYPIEARMVAYFGNMIAVQKGITYEGMGYGGIWPPRVIFVHKYPPKKLKYETVVYPPGIPLKEETKGYDFSYYPTASLIHLGEDPDATDNESIRLITILLRGTDANVINDRLKEEYGIILKEEVQKMESLGMGIYLRAVRETTERVVKETTERVAKETSERVAKETSERVAKETTERVSKETTIKVRQQDNVQAIINMVDELKITIERAMEVLKISKSEQSLYRKLVEEKIGQ